MRKQGLNSCSNHYYMVDQGGNPCLMTLNTPHHVTRNSRCLEDFMVLSSKTSFQVMATLSFHIAETKNLRVILYRPLSYHHISHLLTQEYAFYLQNIFRFLLILTTITDNFFLNFSQISMDTALSPQP